MFDSGPQSTTNASPKRAKDMNGQILAEEDLQMADKHRVSIIIVPHDRMSVIIVPHGNASSFHDEILPHSYQNGPHDKE